MVGAGCELGYRGAREDEEIVVTKQSVGLLAEGGVALAELLHFGGG